MKLVQKMSKLFIKTFIDIYFSFKDYYLWVSSCTEIDTYKHIF